MELNRIGSHLVCLATGGMELGALTGMTAGFREREEVLHLLEYLTGLRMNHAFIRPGGLAQDFPEGWREKVTEFIKLMRSRLPDYDKLLTGQPIWQQRLESVGYLPVDGCLALGATGPILRAAGPAVGPAQGRAVLRLRGVRLRGADGHRGRLLRALPAARGRDARVAEDHRAGRATKMEPGPVMVDDREDRLARAAVGRQRRHGQHARARPQDHGSVDGVADPPLQAGHRGLPRARRARSTRPSSRRAASWAATWSPTAAPARCACTCATPAS